MEYDPAHYHLNRYRAIIPFKSTIVTLPRQDELEGDPIFETYINADYVTVNSLSRTERPLIHIKFLGMFQKL